MGLLIKDHVLHPTHCRSSASAIFFCCLRSSGVIRKKHSCSNGWLPVEQLCFNRFFVSFAFNLVLSASLFVLHFSQIEDFFCENRPICRPWWC
ncbi:hypothetical protein DW084_05175 [Enterococcus casseliflavus]|uniref:Uncharacterized protein n=1 Tax=Enterococcus casseliflavus TaxID=37734 RepID=A0A415EVB8_ENTCA|nr:hypothetical protein DW084_05175 [Enterococcus casseliflavus]